MFAFLSPQDGITDPSSGVVKVKAITNKCSIMLITIGQLYVFEEKTGPQQTSINIPMPSLLISD